MKTGTYHLLKPSYCEHLSVVIKSSFSFSATACYNTINLFFMINLLVSFNNIYLTKGNLSNEKINNSKKCILSEGCLQIQYKFIFY